MSDEILLHAYIYEAACDLIKESFIRKLPNGKYRVFSEKGRNMGTYNTRQEAKKRLRQIEYFKHVKSSSNITYTSVIRSLKNDKDLVKKFKEKYKEAFDHLFINGESDIDEKSLEEALKVIEDKSILKNANAIPMGDPIIAGKSIADLIKFLMQKISEENRPKSLNNLKRKIQNLNEIEISSKQMPASSAIGQSILLIKHMLFSHSPQYVRAVLNSIASNL